jgi:ATP-binding cassette, subfamily A (ABC1), member 5
MKWGYYLLMPFIFFFMQQFLDSVNELWQTMKIGPGQYPIKWEIHRSKEELLGAYWRDPDSMRLAVIFLDDDPYNGQLKYEIRTNPSYEVTPSTSELFSSFVACRQTKNDNLGEWSSVLPIETGESCPVNQYYYSGFIALQALIDYTKIRLQSQNKDIGVPNITLEMFPKAAYTGNWMVAFR